MKSFSQLPQWTRSLIETVVLVAIVALINFYLVPRFLVSGPSMCPTINVIDGECIYNNGENVLLNRLTYDLGDGPQRGDIVVFTPPEGGIVWRWGIIPMKKHYIKRIIGVGGDTITLQRGKVYLSNDKHEMTQIKEPYLSDKNSGRTVAYVQKVFEVPEGKYFVMGDNRAESLDGRRCFDAVYDCNLNNTPFITQKHMRGKATRVIWPWKMRRKLENPLEYLKK